MDKNVERYIQKHTVSENHALIFRNWEEFLHILYQGNGRIKMIIWYEYCKINEQHIGMGGYIDINNKGFMWAETQIFQTDLNEKSLNEILEYILEVKNKYSNYDLYPEFYLY